MAQLEVPLLDRKLASTGDVLLRAELTLLVRDDTHNWHGLVFRVDSGTEMTTMPVARARQMNIPYPQNPVPGLMLSTSAGVAREVRAGGIRIQVLGLDGTEYWVPCYFTGSPAAALVSTRPPNLLGPSGVVDKFRITLDGTPTPMAQYGQLIIETI